MSFFGWFRRYCHPDLATDENHFVLPLPPEPVLKPPPGFRFASNPPSLDDLIHLDNDHPYLKARAGERIEIVKGIISREVIGEGIVIGRMGSLDRRANHINNVAAPGHPEGWPGIYFWNEHNRPEWRACGWQVFHRRNDGVLQLTR